MKKGVKVFLGFMLVVSLLMVLNSCGGQKSEPATTAPAPKTQEPAKASEPAPQQAVQQPAPATAEEKKQETPATTATGGKPKIVCDEPVFDFGERRNDEKVEHEFIIKNAGDGVLLIDRVKTTCGCTVAQPEKKELQPGESTKVKATLTLTGRQGPQTKDITVESNDPENPTFILTLKGVAVSPILVEPRTVNLGSSIAEDLVEEKVIDIKANLPDLKFNILKVDMTDLPQFTSEVKTIEEGKAYQVVLKQVEKIEPGTLSKKITIETDATLPGKDENDPSLTALRKIMITVYGRFLGAVDVAPEVITVRINKENPQERTQQYLRIKEAKEKGLKILEVIPPDDVQVELTERAPGDYLLLVKNIPMNDSLKGKEIVVKTSLAGKPEIKIPFKTIEIPDFPGRPKNLSAPGGARPVPKIPDIKLPPRDQLPKPPAPPQQVPAQPQPEPVPQQ